MPLFLNGIIAIEGTSSSEWTAILLFLYSLGFGSFNSNKYSVNYNSGNSFNHDLGINIRVSQIESDGYREYHHTKQKALSIGIEYKLNNLINQFRSLIGHQNTDLIWDGVYGNDINGR